MAFSTKNRLLEKFYRYGAKILIRTIYRTKFSGFENVPEKGAAILISNHITYMDGLIINAAMKRPVRFVIEKSIYEVPPVKHFMSLNRAIPIEPKRDVVRKALNSISDAMKDGEIVCIFPEGVLTYTGNMTRFRFGVEWMAKRDNVPIIPVALKGLWGSMFSRKDRKSKWRWFPKSFRRKVYAKCGELIPADQAKISHLQRVVMRLKNSIK